MTMKPRTLSGFQELLPPRQVVFDRMVDELRRIYSLYGFTPLDTPVLEAAEVLLAKGGGETEKQIYRFEKGDTDLAMRFDLTVPLAKYVALHYGDLAFPFRRFQIGKVYRGERAQRGRFREFYQADIDVIGDGALDILSEAEIPAIIYRAFTALGLTRFQIRVNNRKVLTGLFAALGLDGSAAEILRTVDKLDKIGAEKVAALLADECGVPPETAAALLGILTSKTPLQALDAYRGQHDLLDLGLAELAAVAGHLADFGVPQTHFTIDLTIARGLDYYTGTVYETVLTDYPEIGSVCSGGRYDNLAEYYTNKQLPGVGISIGLTRLFYILEEQGLLSGELLTAPCDALVIPMTDERGAAIAAATTLRAAGIRAQLYCETRKFKAKLSYADRLGIPFVLLIGEDELACGKVSVKNLTTGAQTMLTAEEAAAHIQAGLKARRDGAVIREKENV